MSPVLAEGVRRAFALTATRRLEAAWAEDKAQGKAGENRSALVSLLCDEIEALLGQALIQWVRVQRDMQQRPLHVRPEGDSV